MEKYDAGVESAEHYSQSTVAQYNLKITFYNVKYTTSQW